MSIHGVRGRWWGLLVSGGSPLQLPGPCLYFVLFCIGGEVLGDGGPWLCLGGRSDRFSASIGSVSVYTCWRRVVAGAFAWLREFSNSAFSGKLEYVFNCDLFEGNLLLAMRNLFAPRTLLAKAKSACNTNPVCDAKTACTATLFARDTCGCSQRMFQGVGAFM